MAQAKISDLTEKVTFDTDDLLEIETAAGVSRQVTASAIITTTTDAAVIAVSAIAYLPNTVAKTASYVILDNDTYTRIECDTTAGDMTITLPLKANNLKRRIEIANVKGGTYKVIIAPNATDANTLSNDGLNAIWLPKVGDFVLFQESATSGFWEIASERITSQLRLDTYAGYGSTDNKIMRFTNVVENVGNMFAENHVSGYSSNAKGLEITPNRSGKYSINYSAMSPAASAMNIGLSLNSSQLTTAVQSISVGTRLMLNNVGANQHLTVSWTGYLKKTDVIRPHGEGGVPNIAADNCITIAYIN